MAGPIFMLLVILRPAFSTITRETGLFQKPHYLPERPTIKTERNKVVWALGRATTMAMDFWILLKQTSTAIFPRFTTTMVTELFLTPLCRRASDFIRIMWAGVPASRMWTMTAGRTFSWSTATSIRRWTATN